jgi:parallel beta-helix repeat protein
MSTNVSRARRSKTGVLRRLFSRAFTMDSNRGRTSVATAALFALIASTFVLVSQAPGGAIPSVTPASGSQVLTCDWLDEMSGTMAPVEVRVTNYVGTGSNPPALSEVTDYTYIVNLDNTADAFDPIAANHAGVDEMASHSPLVTSGTITPADVVSGVATIDLPEGCEYLISVRAEGYKIGGGYVRVETGGDAFRNSGIDRDVLITGADPLHVELVSDQVVYDLTTNQPTDDPCPAPGPEPATGDCGLPLATLVVYAFHDYASVNAAPDGSTEVGLEGFRVLLEDGTGEVTTDFYGSPICGGNCVTGPDGSLTIENLPAGLYATNILTPNGTDWVQTLTIEGTQFIETVVTENFDSLGAEQIFLEGGTVPTIFNYGFVSNTLYPDWGCPVGNKTTEGYCNVGDPAIHHYPHDTNPLNDPLVGDLSGTLYNQVAVSDGFSVVLEDGTNASGISEPVSNAWVALNDVGNHDSQLSLTRADADGAFTIEDVPAGNYQIVIWDEDLNYIIQFHSVVMTSGNQDTGPLGVFRWFGMIEGYVFYDDGIAADGTDMTLIPAVDGTDRAGNGVRDCVDDTTWAPSTYRSGTSIVDPMTCELGLSAVEVLIRNRDGSVAKGTVTDNNGRYEIPDALGPNFKFQILEVGAGTLDWTGHSTHFEADYNIRYSQGYCDAGAATQVDLDLTWFDGALAEPYGPAHPQCQPADAGGALLLASMVFDGHRSEVDFGKLSFFDENAPHVAQGSDYVGNGGILGDVFYGVTRNEKDPAYQAFEDYEFGIPDVELNLYRWDAGLCGDPSSAANDVLAAAGCTTLVDNLMTDHYGQPEAPDPADWNCDIRGADGLLAGTALLNTIVAEPCAELRPNGNEIKDGAWDGGWAFEDLESGEYIVEMLLPAGFQVIKEDDMNTAEGVNLVPNFPPPACVGEYHFPQVGDEYASPFDTFDDAGVYNGGPATRLCDRRHVSVRPLLNAPLDLWVMHTDQPFIPNYNLTDHGDPGDDSDDAVTPIDPFSTAGQAWDTTQVVPPPGRFFGVVLNDLVFDTDPSSVNYGNNLGAANVPMGIYDFTGQHIYTAWTDENGYWEAILPSTHHVSSPIPGGVSPAVYMVIANDPGNGTTTNFGFRNNVLTEPVALDIWPGKMTKADTPIIPIASGECQLPTDSPILMLVNNVWTREGVGTTVEIQGSGFNDAPSATQVLLTHPDGTTVTTLATTAVLTDTPLGYETFTATVPALATTGIYQLDVWEEAGDSPRNGISFHVLAAGDPAPTVVSAGSSIQTAIDAAAAGELILVEPGVYQESVIAHRAVTLQGFGPGNSVSEGFIDVEGQGFLTDIPGTVIDPHFFSFDQVDIDNWNTLAAGLDFHGNPNVAGGAGFTALLETGESTAGTPLMIDGFGITQGRGNFSGGIHLNGYADYAVISNNVLKGNSASRGGGGLSIGVHSDYYVKDLAVSNPGFEESTIADGGFTAGSIAGAWSVSGSAGEYNPTAAQLSSQAIEGLNVAYSNGGTISQVLTGETLSQGRTYTLSVRVGDRSDVTATGYEVELLAGTTSLGTVTHLDAPIFEDGWIAVQIQHTAVAGDELLGDLQIKLSSADTQTEFDDVSLVADGGVSPNTNVSVVHNRIFGNGGILHAGGVGIFNGSDNYLLEDNDIACNYAGEYGGGISHFGLSTGGQIVGNAIYYNEAFDEGGGVMLGGESATNSIGEGLGSVDFDSNYVLLNKSGDDGGGVMVLAALNGAIKMHNNIIANNIATSNGGGIHLDNAGDVEIVNNTITNNINTSTAEDSPLCGTLSCAFGAGLTGVMHSPAYVDQPVGQTYTDPVLFNNIFYNNQSFVWDTINNELVLDTTVGDLEIVGDGMADSDPGAPAFHPEYSLLTTDYPSAGATAFTNHVGFDPLFVLPFFELPDPTPAPGGFMLAQINVVRPDESILVTSNYHLTDPSPASNVGVDMLDGVFAPELDIDGDMRLDTPTGPPTSEMPEIGADENPTAVTQIPSLYLSNNRNRAPIFDEDISSWALGATQLQLFLDTTEEWGLAGTADINAFDIVDANTVFVSFNTPTAVLGLGTVDDSDIVRFDYETEDIVGWIASLALDGSDVGLTTGAEDIDALWYDAATGSMLISTTGTVVVPAGPGAGLRNFNEDILRVTPTDANDFVDGQVEAATFAVFFDGSDVTVDGNVSGIDFTGGRLFVALFGNESVDLGAGPPTPTLVQSSDVIVCNLLVPGEVTVCPEWELFLDGATVGLTSTGDRIDGLSR